MLQPLTGGTVIVFVMATLHTYGSRVDAWLAAVLILAVVLVSGASLAAAVDTGNLASLAPAVIMGLVLGLLVFPIRYTMQEDLLLIQSGVLKYRVPYAEITDVSPSREAWSSPAMSLDRLKIQYGAGKSILISPENQAEFVNELSARVESARSR
jgi:hypothetical protein